MGNFCAPCHSFVENQPNLGVLIARRRISCAPAKPNKPTPNSTKLAGSGTALERVAMSKLGPKMPGENIPMVASVVGFKSWPMAATSAPYVMAELVINESRFHRRSS